MVRTVASSIVVSNRFWRLKLTLSCTPALRRVLLRLLDALRVDIDAERARAALGCGNGDAAVAGAQVDHEVARLDLGHVQHTLDHLRRRRHVRHVQRRRLAALRRARRRRSQ